MKFHHQLLVILIGIVVLLACVYVFFGGHSYSSNPPSGELGCICTMEYAPVCGVDGMTYGNACGAACAQVTVAYAGECAAE